MTGQIISAVSKPEGDGARVKRLFPNNNYNDHYDPFVLLDEFFVKPPNKFAPHEHRGFEAITYMLEGHFIHEDNQGNRAEVGPGGVQAFNAGKSIIHSEKPGEEVLSHGIQLWINLPKEFKKSNPDYQEIKAKDIPQTIKDGQTIRQIAGKDSPVKLHSQINYLDISLNAGKEFSDQLPAEHQGLIYLISGKVEGDFSLDAGKGILLNKANQFKIRAIHDSRFLLLTGKPLNQEITINGTFVE